MRSNVLSLVAATALLASVGSANAKDPVKLTDVQLDKITAGATQTSADVAAAIANVNVAADNLGKAALNYLVAVNTATGVVTNAALSSLSSSPITTNAALSSPITP
jgi:predicted amino acid dehydrogenase